MGAAASRYLSTSNGLVYDVCPTSGVAVAAVHENERLGPGAPGAPGRRVAEQPSPRLVPTELCGIGLDSTQFAVLFRLPGEAEWEYAAPCRPPTRRSRCSANCSPPHLPT
jgi:hypothetical protein